MCKREKNRRIVKNPRNPLRWRSHNEVLSKSPCNHVFKVWGGFGGSKKRLRTSSSSSHLILSYFYSLFYFTCISYVSINHCKSISTKSLLHLDNNVHLISQSSHKKRGLKEEDPSRLVHSMFYYFEIILNGYYTNKN